MSDSLPRRLLPAAGILLAVVLVAWSMLRIVDQRRERQRLERMQARVAQLRSAADSCLLELGREERAFRRYDVRVDSLRERVRSFETEPGGRVEAEAYDRYMESFDRYNEAVPEWHALADSLRAHEASCRAMLEGYNATADSFRAEVQGAGDG